MTASRARRAVVAVVVIALSLLLVALSGACAKTAPAPVPAPAPTQAKVPEKIQWDISLAGGPRSVTYPIEDFAKDMQAGTNGRWEIKLHYGEVLAPLKDNPDGIKAGTFDGALLTGGVHPGKTPLLTILTSPFIGPPTEAQIYEWAMALAQHPAVVKEVDAWNVKILFPCTISQYNLMGKVAIRKVDDFKGVRVRSAPDMGKPMQAFGAVITMVPPPEVYTALERGMVDTVAFSWPSSFGSFKLYEISKYATIDMDMALGDSFFAVSKNAWNKLPDEWKKLANEAIAKTNDRYVKYIAADSGKFLPLYEKQGIEIIKFPPGERAKLLEKAKPTWEEWVKNVEAKGLPGREIFDFVNTERDKVMAKIKK